METEAEPARTAAQNPALRHWGAMAEIWRQVGPPLRPSPEDQKLYWSFIHPWIAQLAEARVLILGVTPELFHLPWPKNCHLLACDRAREMIDNFWPGRPEQVLEADWRELPLPNESRDLVLCDGGLILLDPAGQRALVDRLSQVLAPGGRGLLRLFALPEFAEAPEQVMEDLLARRIPSLNILKLRLGMALQESPEKGIAVHQLWKLLHATEPDWTCLAERVGWPVEHLRAIDAYHDSPACYRFPTVAGVEELFCGTGQFVSLGRRTGKYPLAERCPVVAFARS